jgi:hypothetical protein
MLIMLAQLTLGKIKSLLSYFRGSVVLHTLEHSRTDQIKCIVSQLVEAYAHHERVVGDCSIGGRLF